MENTAQPVSESMKRYIGTKELLAVPMTRGRYNSYRNSIIPIYESPDDEGYLVEYIDGGKPNDDRHKGYISWSPKDVFEKAYKKSETFLDRLNIELEELKSKHLKLKVFLYDENNKFTEMQESLLEEQFTVMGNYIDILETRIKLNDTY